MEDTKENVVNHEPKKDLKGGEIKDAEASLEQKTSSKDELLDKDTKDTESTSRQATPNEKKSTTSNAAIIMSVLALILGAGGLALGWIALDKTSVPITFLNSGTDGNSANFVEGSIAEIADKVSKSVVSIVTSSTVTNFFGQSYDTGAAGTGIIASADGYIITNKHVINGAKKVTVFLDDGTSYEDVEVVATDPLNDIAFLKIKDVSDLPAATLGDSKTINVGQQVIAIGNALGEYKNSVTSGIVSGVGRSVTASDGSSYNVETLSDMIQTDAAINSGNSGGPLVNAAGEVIGINTATSTSAENMGFAIPISSTKGMLAQLKETGKAERAFLGVYSTQITPDAAKAYNLPVTSGAYLYSSSTYSAIAKDSPAAKAGLKDKDIVLAVNGVKVGEAGTLSDLVSEYKPNDTVQLTVLRDGNEIAVNVTLGAYKK